MGMSGLHPASHLLLFLLPGNQRVRLQAILSTQYIRRALISSSESPPCSFVSGPVVCLSAHQKIVLLINNSSQCLLEPPHENFRMHFLKFVYFYLTCMGISRHVCLCTVCMSGAPGGQKRLSGPMELEFLRWSRVILYTCSKWNPGPQEEEPMFITTKLPLYPSSHNSLKKEKSISGDEELEGRKRKEESNMRGKPYSLLLPQKANKDALHREKGKPVRS